MADKDFAIKNGISISGGAVSINSSAFYVSGSQILNSVNYVGTANNATFAYGKVENALSVDNAAKLGGTAAASFQLNSTLAANVATMTANNATNLGGVAASGYLQSGGNPTISGNWTFSGTVVYTGTVNLAQANIASQTLADGATVTANCALGPIWFLTIAGNRTMAAPTNPKIGTYLLYVKQDATGSRTITWNATFKWPAAVAPVLTTTANAVDLISLTYDGTNWYGSFIPDLR